MFWVSLVLAIFFSSVFSAEPPPFGFRINVNKTGNNKNESLMTTKDNFFGVLYNISLLYLDQPLQKIALPNGANIETWVAPHGIPKRYVYYQAGYDEDNRPIWVVEAGKWFVKGAIVKGHLSDLDMYIKQLAYRVLRSMRDMSTTDGPVTEAIFLIDFEHLQYEQLAHPPTLAYVLDLAREYRQLIDTYLGDSIIINVNYVAAVVLDLVRPIFGGIFEKVTIYGNTKVRYIPHLVRHFSKANLPAWYGGSKDFRPLRVYG